MTNNAAAPLKNSDTISKEAEVLLSEEVVSLEQTLHSLGQQLEDMAARFHRERVRARELTSRLVDARRDEDRQQIASDEAVSHALTTQHDETVSTLQSQKEKPYFARMMLDEEELSGEIRRIEYKIGYAANPSCRIIDWKRAPLAKLYYEYREGDEYCEQVLGKERLGRIVLRNRVEIEQGELKQVTCRYGNFFASSTGWVSAASGQRFSPRNFGSLPEVLSLISPEQFSAITKDSNSAVLIQGVAGSGKTTVALHRLSWLLAQGKDLAANDCVVLTLGPSLREYVRSSLAALQISDVPVFSFREWCTPQLIPYLPTTLRKGSKGEPELTPSGDRPLPSVEYVKRSMGLLTALEKTAQSLTFTTNPLELLLATLRDTKRIKECDETKLISEQSIQAAYRRTSEMEQRGSLDRSDFSLLLRCLQLTVGAAHSSKRPSLYKHIVVDEVQDYSPIELATVLSAVTELGHVTLVGDTTQRTEEGFPGWEKLRRWWTTRKIENSFIKLEVSHRSTQQIIACAAYLGGLDTPPPAGGRKGARPQWLFSRQQELALGATLTWLQRALDANPRSLIGVLCFSSADVKEAYKYLSPSFGALVRIGEESQFSFEEGIIICEVYAAKGLEFHSVLVYNPVFSKVPQGDVGKHLLYIASTRAQEQLAFVTWENSPLRTCPERIFDKVDLDSQEEEEETSSNDDEN